MTFGDMPFAQEVGKLSYTLLNGLRMVLASISATWSVEHEGDGHHTDITCDSVTEQGRSAAMGEWIDVPYAAGNFTASAGTWTVELADVLTYRYMLIGNTMFVNVFLINTTIAGATPASLYVALPQGFKIPRYVQGAAQLVDNGTYAPGSAYVAATYQPAVTIARADNAAFAAAANTTEVRFSIFFEVVEQ